MREATYKCWQFDSVKENQRAHDSDAAVIKTEVEKKTNYNKND